MEARDQHLVGLIGAGIGASLSPALHEREAARQGVRYEYRLLGVEELGAEPEDLLRTAREEGWSGLNVTHPCKRAIVEHLDELSRAAEQLDAVNTVVFDDGRAVGHNTDTTGFAESFARGLPDVARDRVVLLGAGGAGAAVAHAARSLGVMCLVIVDLDEGAARELAERVGGTAGELQEMGQADGLIHATPVGMAAHPGLPLPAERLRRDLWVAEVVYRPLETELLQRARELGCRTLDGGGMAVYQAVRAFELFSGRAPDADRMTRAFAAPG
jgi:shikimate dehydrogenase